MLPDFLLTVGNSMQDISCDDFGLINGGNANTSLRTELLCQNTFPAKNNTTNNNNNNNNTSNPNIHQNSITTKQSHFIDHHHSNKFDASLLRGIKLEDAQGGLCAGGGGEQELIEVKPETWQQQQQLHLQQNNQHQNHYQQLHTQRSQSNHHHHNHHSHHNHHPHHHHHHHQLLLQGSDDPLICHGADSVVNDDDHSFELKHLLTAASNGQQQQQQQQQQPQQHHSSSTLQTKQLMASNTPPPMIATKRPQNGCSSLTKQQLKVKAGLMSQQQRQEAAPVQNTTTTTATTTTKSKSKSKKKITSGNIPNAVGNGSGAVKLRFHHQALPPEYLSHYKATQRQIAPHTTTTTKDNNNNSATSTAVKASQTAKLPPPKSSHENVRSWLQKIAEIQRAAQQQQQSQTPKNLASQTSTQQSATPTTAPAPAPPHDANNNHQTCRMSGTRSPHLAATATFDCSTSISTTAIKPMPTTTIATTAPLSSRTLKFSDLPYMGEITLNNSKPRRGRKPKKADICHLIYKNYGTIFAGVPKPPPDGGSTNSPLKVKSLSTAAAAAAVFVEEQPLNLCLRDYQSLDLYSVSSGDGNCDGDGDGDGEIDFNGDISDSCESHSNCTTPGDALTDTMLATNMKSAMPSLMEAGKVATVKSEHMEAQMTTNNNNLHPVRAYYQKLLETGVLVKQSDGTTSTFAGLPIETIEKDNQIALKIPIPSGLFLIPKMEGKPPLDYPEPLSTPSSIKSEQSFTTTNSSNVTNSNSGGVAPQKRKRSAIFIPPMPADNATNPANEVSICKFKFTGGAKPTLQEKKMLSVDSDGNYRYYSGTGDKSMRGYEFFPRESLQQSGFLPGVGGAGAFLNATGEKISIDILPPSAELSNELLQIPDSPTGTLQTNDVLEAAPAAILTNGRNTTQMPMLVATQLSPPNTFRHKRNHTHTTGAGTGTVEHNMLNLIAPVANEANATLHHRKKKLSSRRSSQREKLERTFKEKGFLIQTQQLESAEGATYCKFRQLKKFTRYLFRNWKDYLPDGQMQVVPAAEGADSQQATAAIERLLIGHEFDGVKPMQIDEHKKISIVNTRQQGISEARTQTADMGVGEQT